MVFSSTIFLAWFLPVFMSLYLLADRRYKNMLILLGSVLFFAWGAPKFVFLILLTTFADFYLVRWMHGASDPRRRKQLLWLSISLNVGILVVFKYANFVVLNLSSAVHALTGGQIPWVEVALPIGISFFVFESLTYVVDVYRVVHKPLTNFWDYQMYIMMFPKLIAGPIVRYHELADQIHGRTHSLDMFLTGFYRFCIGLGKKVLIANTLGSALLPFQGLDPATFSAAQAWMASAALLMQFYFDFSGYSDMASGLGRMMGFHLPENFDNPFTSDSVTTYWKRWHMTFSHWMRNYLYIPLGGNHVERPWLVYRNLWIVFVISGLWHGANWNFLLFGVYHGFWLVVERAFLGRYLAKLPYLLRVLFTCLVVLVGINVFWKADLGQLGAQLLSLVGGGAATAEIAVSPEFWWVLGIAVFFSWFRLIPGSGRVEAFWFGKSHGLAAHGVLLLLSALLYILCFAFVNWTPYNPFLYFQF